jgi:tellurite resistance protein TerC
MSINEFLFFSTFLLFVTAMLVLDLGVLNRKQHVISFKEAGIWSTVWISLALGFYAVLYFHGHIIHDIDSYEKLTQIIERYHDDDEVKISPQTFESSLQNYRSNLALEFLTGYLLEYSLSADNIFVIIMIFASFGVRELYFKKVLFWGILGAIIMRFTFIFAGSALIQKAHWILYLFGVFLLFSGAKMLFNKGDDTIDPQNHKIVKLVSRYFAVFPRYVGERFFILRNGKTMITPLFVVLIIIEFTDLVFAIDSVPAVFAVTKDPYIVFFSNIFAILGLRSMFFFLSNIMHIFHYLKTGLSFLLMFIGFKMIAYDYVLKPIGFKTYHSLIIILGILATSIILSLVFPPKKVQLPVASVPSEEEVRP